MPLFELHVTINNPFRYEEFSKAANLIGCKPIFIKLHNNNHLLAEMALPLQAMLGFKGDFIDPLAALNYGYDLTHLLKSGQFKVTRIKVESPLGAYQPPSKGDFPKKPKYFEAHFKLPIETSLKEFCFEQTKAGLYFSEGIGEDQKLFLTCRTGFARRKTLSENEAIAYEKFNSSLLNLRSSKALKNHYVGSHFEEVWFDTFPRADKGWFAEGGYPIA